MMNNLSKIEETLFKEFCKEKISNIVFILASPRTGSTPFYQALVSSSGCPYISNFTNTYFSEYPVIGLSIQHGTKSVDSLKSKYGKTNNLFGASEGSALFANWFGGGHPSQEVSSEAKEEKKSHFEKTVNSISALYGKPLIIKNAWNCFRIQSIVNIFPMAKFIWLKRDIGEAAKSDLEAKLGQVWKAVRSCKDSWPFHKAVDKNVVPDYFKVITEPMDLDTMYKRLNSHYYKNKEMFIYDFMLIVNNCKSYNSPDTIYYRSANIIKDNFLSLMTTFGLK